MTLRQRFASWLFNKLQARYVYGRQPDFIIGSRNDPCVYRWYLLGSKPAPTAEDPNKVVSKSILGFRPYLHCFVKSDDDRACHDHPSLSVSFGLHHQCVEHTIAAGGVHRRRTIKAGEIVFRSAKFAHRIEIVDYEFWSLFIFGPNFREWGFHCKTGWVHWKKFTSPSNSGAIGEGCGE